MLVYRTDVEGIDPRLELRRLARRAADATSSSSHDEIAELFIDAAELTSAVADSIFHETDGLSDVVETLNDVTRACAGALLASWRGTTVAPSLERIRAACGAVPEDALPVSAERRVSEGYAYYALHPETYAAAALRFADRVQPAAAVCVGIRTIGAGLAAVVATALATAGIPAQVYSVRPRGHPFDRVLRLDVRLREALRNQPSGTHYLIVDEGPGISGTSFSCAVAALAELGMPSSTGSAPRRGAADPSARDPSTLCIDPAHHSGRRRRSAGRDRRRRRVR